MMFQSWLGRLKKSGAFRVAGVYAVTGYAVFQIANNLFPALKLPSWSVSLTAALFLLGFPLVIGITLAMQRDTLFAADASALVARPGWFDWTLLAATLLILVFAAGRFFGSDAASPGPHATADTAAAPARSIAVLPFVNFGVAREDESFADGLTEELINGLAQVADLRVAGRTSAFYFKGRNEDLREIGRKLGVAHVLEGSVRRSGSNLRITAQLIKVEDGFHLWSQTFDRNMKDAFAIQSQISAAVAQALRAKLMLVTDAALPADRDPQAYEIELRARAHLRQQELAELQTARQLYEQLMQLEPANPRAHIGYAEATLFLAQNYLALDFDQARRQSEAALTKALKLDERYAEAWRVKGLMERILAIRSGDQVHSDLALAAFRRAVDLDPRNSDALAMLAAQLDTVGQATQAISLLNRALEIDPLSRLAQQQLAATLASLGRFGEARRQYESLASLYPDFSAARVSLGRILLEQGKLDLAVARLDDPKLIREDPLAGLLLASCYANLGLERRMQAVLESIKASAPAAAVAKAVLLQRAGRRLELGQLAQRQLKVTRDPLWSSIALLSAVMEGDVAKLRRIADQTPASLLRTPPEVKDFLAIDVLLRGHALRVTGRAAVADSLALAVLRQTEAASGEYQPVDLLVERAMAHASLNEADAALKELEKAVANGYRTLIDFEYFIRLEDYPFMATVVRLPRFRSIVSEIESDNRRMRDAVLASRP